MMEAKESYGEMEKRRNACFDKEGVGWEVGRDRIYFVIIA
jgi:hypothetical protein